MVDTGAEAWCDCAADGCYKLFTFLFSFVQLVSTGVDALVKVWVIKTSECISTFEDGHDDKVTLICDDTYIFQLSLLFVFKR